MHNRLPLIVACLLLLPTALAQPIPDHGIEWRTIGAAGNADATFAEFPGLGLPGGLGPIGGVNYEFRLSRTELSVSQYFEFVQKYTRWNAAAAFDPGLYGSHIVRLSNDPSNLRWAMLPDAVEAPADMAWLYAARFVNWLHNDKVDAVWAFESGAYDMSTFVRQADGTWTGQAERSADARFWIPSLDEWTKAMHYDPNKHGPGQPGYWAFPHSSDQVAIGGLPGTPGAQTSAGEYPGGEGYRFFPVGSYPDAQSPWGLLDGSGGEPELLEHDQTPFYGVLTRGSSSFDLFPFFGDRLDFAGTANVDFSGNGLRIASAIPSPSATCILGLAFLALRPHVRRR